MRATITFFDSQTLTTQLIEIDDNIAIHVSSATIFKNSFCGALHEKHVLSGLNA